MAEVEGWEHVEGAVEIYAAVITDLFTLPGAAADRTKAERPTLEVPHGEDLLCGCWRAPETASAFLEMAGRHMEAIQHLAGISPAFAMPAWSLSRGVLEQCLRVAWLLSPARAAAREQRWIALERENKRYFKNTGVLDEKQHAQIAQAIDEMVERGEADPVPGVPSVERMAEEFSPAGNLYTHYRLLSQPLHGTTVGAGTFDYEARFEWNALGGEGEWVEAEFWSIPLIASWEAAHVAMVTYRDLLAPDHLLPSLDRCREFMTSLARVPANFQARKSMESRAIKRRSANSKAPAANRAQRRAAARKNRRR